MDMIGTVIATNTAISSACSARLRSATEKYSTVPCMISQQPSVAMMAGACTRSKNVGRRSKPGGGGHTQKDGGGAKKAGGAQRGQPGARQHQQGHDDFKPKRQHGGNGGSGFGHSITSPRSRNLAMAMLPTKLNR